MNNGTAVDLFRSSQRFNAMLASAIFNHSWNKICVIHPSVRLPNLSQYTWWHLSLTTSVNRKGATQFLAFSKACTCIISGGILAPRNKKSAVLCAIEMCAQSKGCRKRQPDWITNQTLLSNISTVTRTSIDLLGHGRNPISELVFLSTK